MTRIIPSDISPLALAGAHSWELDTLAQLKNLLGPEYVLFHSVHWSFSQGQGTRFGEIDFILVNRAGAVLIYFGIPVLEVSGGLEAVYSTLLAMETAIKDLMTLTVVKAARDTGEYLKTQYRFSR
ncbi:MAG: hypothetical protein QG599_3780 [Pseudomonadota bacterium]|nr:hypothetical protein [Pseudomonadota bacterium]